MTANIEDFGNFLSEALRSAQSAGKQSIDINSGELHRAVGGYPSASHRMPVCCDAMYREKRPTDAVLSSPPKGKGATLTIRYFLPR